MEITRNQREEDAAGLEVRRLDSMRWATVAGGNSRLDLRRQQQERNEGMERGARSRTQASPFSLSALKQPSLPLDRQPEQLLVIKAIACTQRIFGTPKKTGAKSFCFENKT